RDDAIVPIRGLQRTLAAGHAQRRRPLPRALGRSLVSPDQQRFPPKLFADHRRRDLRPAKRRGPPNPPASLPARQSRLRNRLRTKQPPRLGRHSHPRHQTYFEIGLILSERSASAFFHG